MMAGQQMDLRQIAESLNAIHSQRTNVANELETVLTYLHRVYEHYDRAMGEARRLDAADALTGQRKIELRELVEDLAGARKMVAEVVHVLVGLSRDRTAHSGLTQKTASAAHEGMQAKALGTWEVNALREAVVEGLAGPGAK